MKQLVVTAAVIELEGRILIAQRKPEAHLALKWEFPGGKLEWGEHPRDGLQREIREELGIEVEALDVVEVVSHTYEDRQIVLIAYACRFLEGTVQRLDVHDVRWVLPDELLAVDWAPADVPIVDELLRRYEP